MVTHKPSKEAINNALDVIWSATTTNCMLQAGQLVEILRANQNVRKHRSNLK